MSFIENSLRSIAHVQDESDGSGRRRIVLTTSSIPAVLPQVSAARAVSNSSSVMISSVRKGIS